MDQVQHWLATLPPLLVYLVVAVVIGTESLGIPVPGEIALVSAAVLASTGAVSVGWVAVAASTGAIVGDSIGYAIGRRGGRRVPGPPGRPVPPAPRPPPPAPPPPELAPGGAWGALRGPVG